MPIDDQKFFAEAQRSYQEGIALSRKLLTEASDAEVCAFFLAMAELAGKPIPGEYRQKQVDSAKDFMSRSDPAFEKFAQDLRNLL